MKRKKVQAVIYKEEEGKKEYLILHRKLYWSGWELLKETMEQGESFEDTLRRGIQEEIGVLEIKIEKEKKVHIPFDTEQGIVYVFLVKIDAKEKIDITQEQEHDAHKWVTKAEALKLLTYENAKELLEELTKSQPA